MTGTTEHAGPELVHIVHSAQAAQSAAKGLSRGWTSEAGISKTHKGVALVGSDGTAHPVQR